jgi:hypothetical protein
MSTPKRKYSIRDSLLQADWQSIAQALNTIDTGIEGNGPSARKLRAQLGVIKVIMCENMRTWNGNSTIDASLLIATYKTIQRMEAEFNSRGIENRQFLIFLKLLLQKFEQQKLKVKKPFVLINEFGKMKGVVEKDRF